jgi:hypothetical protein
MRWSLPASFSPPDKPRWALPGGCQPVATSLPPQPPFRLAQLSHESRRRVGKLSCGVYGQRTSSVLKRRSPTDAAPAGLPHEADLS